MITGKTIIRYLPVIVLLVLGICIRLGIFVHPHDEGDELIYQALIEQIDSGAGYTLQGHHILESLLSGYSNYDSPLFFHPPGGIIFFYAFYRLFGPDGLCIAQIFCFLIFYTGMILLAREIFKPQNLKGKRVLELGVGDAALTKKVFELGAIVDAIEIDAVSSESAAPYCRRVYRMDIEDAGNTGPKDQYDIIVAADILEHMKDPELILSRLKTYLKTGGLLIVSLPNVANIYVRFNVLFGRFPYHTRGILDKTHLHFYTLKTAEQLLIKTGWVIEERDITSIPLCTVFPFLTRHIFILKLFFQFAKMMKGLLAYQGIFYCINPNRPYLLS